MNSQKPPKEAVRDTLDVDGSVFFLKQKMFFVTLIVLLFIFSPHLFSEEMDKIIEEGLKKGITVDLREPLYSDGILSTTKGGVITTSQLRIQATCIHYIRKAAQERSIWTIEAEGNLIVEFGEYIFVGEKLQYDFNSKQGVVFRGKTEVEPWIFGGERLELRADGSYFIYDGYVTTSEKEEPDWGIYSNEVCLEQNQFFKARDVHLKVFDYTVLWVPSARANLNSIFDNPIRYRFRWGGRQGPRLGLTYEIFSWVNWKTFVRFDYRLTRGPGAGIETLYHSDDGKTEFHSVNYLAKDSSIFHPNEKARYRFEGVFRKSLDEDKTRILLNYDKISDKDMPSYYNDRDFDFDTSERTQLLIRRQEDEWIGNFYARVRINSFQTVKQQLPSLEINFKPFPLRDTGILFENFANASYLNFEYSKYLVHVRNYESSRLDYRPTFYRPISFGQYFTVTPEIGIVSIMYGNSQDKEARWMALGKGGVNFQTQIYRTYGPLKHVIEPYAFYHYYSSPTVSSHKHFIFDINDGWARLNYLSFGVNNVVYRKNVNSSVKRLFSVDLYSFAFFDTDKIYQTIPKIYGNVVLFFHPTLKHSIDAAWNIEHHQVDFFNISTKWTLNADFAIRAEYRHRGPYRWRKVDEENFFLDVFHSENQLLHSPESDRRDTLLLHFFYRFHPNWACEVTSRQGWNRLREPSYLEFEIDLVTTIQTAWHLRLSYQHQENDDRVAMYLNIGLRRPTHPTSSSLHQCFD